METIDKMIDILVQTFETRTCRHRLLHVTFGNQQTRVKLLFVGEFLNSLSTPRIASCQLDVAQLFWLHPNSNSAQLNVD